MKKLNQPLIAAQVQPKTLHAQKGFSLPSVIVGSVIAAVLGGVALTSMWDSVDKAKISAEKQTIAEVKTAIAGVIQSNGYSFPTSLTTTVDGYFKDRLTQMPKDLKYSVVLKGTGATSYLMLQAEATTDPQANHLNQIVSELDKNYDGTEDAAAGLFQYNTTDCEADGNGVVTASTCFYQVYLAAKTTKPTTITAAHDDGGTANNISPLNY